MAKFSPEFIEDLKNRVLVSSVIGRTVSWDRRKTNAGKGDFWACCPFHAEKSPSFHADDSKGRYHCFGCKAGGDVFTFLMEKNGLSYPEAVEQLAADAGMELPISTPEEEHKQKIRASLYDVMASAAEFFVQELKMAGGKVARDYLESRNVSPEVQKQFGLGFAPAASNSLINHLAKAGISVEQMIEAGLVVASEGGSPHDRFRDRVMFPIKDSRMRVIAFGGRALSKEARAKYLNSPDTPLFKKGNGLYNYADARGEAHRSGKLYVVEGYMDTIAMHRANIRGSVATLGTAMTEQQLSLLWRTVPEPIVCFDGDGAGVKAAYRALDLALPLVSPGHSLSFVFFPDGLDPDDLLRRSGPDGLLACLGAPMTLLDVLWRRALELNDRQTPERRALFESDLAEAVATIQNEVVRKHYQSAVRDMCWNLFHPGRKDTAQAGQSSGKGLWKTATPGKSLLGVVQKLGRESGGI